jgi:hypothetical protein
LFAGIETNLIVHRERDNIEVFEGISNTTAISTYNFTGMAGPTLRFLITDPKRRYFSTYVGATEYISFDNGEPVFQPILGTRYFIDLNKSVSIEARYLEYTIKKDEYVFNPYGDAIKSGQRDKTLGKTIISLGLQIVF